MTQIFPSFFNDFIQNEMRNKITVNELMSARGALKTFHIFDRVLIGEGHLSERGAYFKILKNRKFRFLICVLKLNVTFLYLKNTEFST